MRRIGLLLLLGLSAGAHAQEIQGVYAGISLGLIAYDEDGDNLGAPISDNTSAYRVFGGYQFNSVYAIEVGRGVSGEFGERFGGFDTTGASASLTITGEYEISTLRFIALAPFSDLGMFGGVGYYDATLDGAFHLQTSGDAVGGPLEDSDDGFTVVGGIVYEFDRLAVRGEYEWFDADDGVELQSINVSALFRF